MKTGFRGVLMAVVLTACDSGSSGPTEDEDDGSVLPGEEDGAVPNADARVMTDGSARDARVPREAMPPPPDCGDNNKAGAEQCDDGNVDDSDGCSSQCTKEEGFNCPTGAGACAPVCGDGLLVQGEACDDANVVSADGCSDSCQLENGWLCLGSGAACMSAGCSDGVIAGGESCDDGNMVPGDGCSTTCAMEAGWLCPAPGTPCLAERCGDGVRAGSEACDDGETNGMPKSGDGCTGACDAVEPNYSCPATGGACTRTSICGNGVLTSDEQCDDRNTAAGDGCSAACIKEAGFVCTSPGRACAAVCGDSQRRGTETCDDGDTTSGDGCDKNCQIEDGWKCAGATCTRTTCGDGVVEGSEQCDDGANDKPYDGCYKCQKEPTCTNAGCTSVCGDGIKFPDEACDDGNKRSGDGCSATCVKESGFVCTDVNVGTQSLELPIVLRDFRGNDLGAITTGGKNIAAGHRDFERNIDSNPGAVKTTLDVQKKPVLSDVVGSTFSTAANFAQWYRDQPAGQAEFVRTVPHTLTLTKVGAGFQFSSDAFFPLDGKGFVATGDEPTRVGGPAGRTGPHNFSFTSELRYWFQYKGNENLDFTGDDDVWVFINGTLAVDLGGVHGAANGSVTLNAAAATKFGLTIGKIYEAVLFQAERHTSNSNYKLTLTGFDRVRSSCASVCGDGVITSDEACDDGVNTGGYGGCKADCSGLGPHCGDSIKQGNEACDSGYTGNTGSYNGCTADCKAGPKCGDGKVDGFYGEQCDLPTGNVGGYGGCASTCRFSERCGDGMVQEDEQCDDGQNRSAYGGCGPGCKLAPSCGDGMVQSARGEQCDLGTDNNTGAYGGCTVECKKAARCGDRVLDEANGEQCDDGNQNNFDGCSKTCLRDTVI